MGKKKQWEVASEALIGQEITWIDGQSHGALECEPYSYIHNIYAVGTILRITRGSVYIRMDRGSAWGTKPGKVKRFYKPYLMQQLEDKEMIARIEASTPPPSEVREHDHDPYEVYALTDPMTGIIHYIGITNDRERRYREHVTCSGTNREKNMWVISLLQQELQPAMEVIERVTGLREAKKRETHWIIYHLARLAPLTNVLSDEIREQASVEHDILLAQSVRLLAQHFDTTDRLVHRIKRAGWIG